MFLWKDGMLKILKALGVVDKLSYGNDKDCAPFSRLCLELVTMQKYADQKICRHKKMPMWKDLNY